MTSTEIIPADVMDLATRAATETLGLPTANRAHVEIIARAILADRAARPTEAAHWMPLPAAPGSTVPPAEAAGEADRLLREADAIIVDVYQDMIKGACARDRLEEASSLLRAALTGEATR